MTIIFGLTLDGLSEEPSNPTCTCLRKNTVFFEIDGRETLIGKAKDARGMPALLYFAMK
jgi:hypothetical protein